ncbi:MAG: Tex-like N-terminal domain-containing protein, partial [Pygmaiobacter sp.]
DERLTYLRGLEKRKAEVAASIDTQGAFTDELKAALDAALTLAAVEDLYRPYKPKRKTRASIAKEKGLSPLAELLFSQQDARPALTEAADFISEERGVASAAAALAGALDIIAESISDDAKLRALLRNFYQRSALITSKAAKAEADSVYEQYYDFSEAAAKIPEHRVLAIDRGEREGFLKVTTAVDSEEAVRLLCFNVVKNSGEYSRLVADAVADSYNRLLHPSLERELRSALTERAAEGAIKLFSENLRNLLLQPPIKGKVALGLDPGYRMGCKIAVVDATGKVLTTDVIYPLPAFKRVEQAKDTVKKLMRTYGVEIIAIGNGTASKETELFAAEILHELAGTASYMVVSESGASVYSASKLAAQEFPDYDVNVRSAISIARRLQDPLAELVKIDPKAVGVGQYQHDMPAAKLDEALSGVVEYCVNTVGVDLNTASASLLSHVAGISAATAKNIVTKRETDGAFVSRTELKKVPKLGPKAFEQCAGFLRVPGAKNKLDTTAVHPESYAAAKQ